MLREYGVYPGLERVGVPFEAGEADVPRYVDCYIQDAERRAEGYPPDMGGGRFAPGDYRYAFQVLLWLLRTKRIARGAKFLEWGSGQGMVAILAQLLGMLYKAGEQKNRDSRISESADTVLRIIEKRYPEKLTLDSIARTAGQSKFYLAHRFKAEMGMTIYGYLTLFRISKSKVLLQNTNLPVSAIAEQVGFSGTSNFIRTFSACEAMTPHQYRKQWQ